MRTFTSNYVDRNLNLDNVFHNGDVVGAGTTNYQVHFYTWSYDGLWVYVDSVCLNDYGRTFANDDTRRVSPSAWFAALNA